MKNFKITSVFILFAFLPFIFQQPAKAILLDKMVSVFNDQIITQSMVTRLKNTYKSRKFLAPQIYDLENTNKKTITDLIIKRLMIREKLKTIKDEFSIFSDPRDKYVYLVDLAKMSNGISKEEQIEQNRIHGCTSQAWIIKESKGTNYYFKTDSDAMIVKGLLSLIERSFNGHSSDEIREIDGSKFLEAVGLDRAISSQRTNGFSSAINKIQKDMLD